MFTLLALTALAHATDLQPGLYQPGAVPMEGGSGYVGAAGVMGVTFGQVDPYAGLRAAYAPVDRLAIVAGGIGNELQTLASVGVRYNVYEHENVNLAVMGFGTGHLRNDDGYRVQSYLAGTGLAADVGGSRVRFDATVPLVGVMVDPGQDDTDFLPGLLSYEAGVSFIGGEGHSRFRMGATGPMAALSYRWTEPRWYVEGGVTGNLFANELHIGAGTVF